MAPRPVVSVTGPDTLWFGFVFREDRGARCHLGARAGVVAETLWLPEPRTQWV